MEIRKADISDIEALAANRFEFVRSLRNEDVVISEEFIAATYGYMREHMADQTMSAWIAVNDGKIVACAVVCYYSILPLMSNQTGGTGYLLNVYTLPEFRRKGLATKLLNNIVREAKERNVGKLYLSATDMGRPVYEKLGFELLTREMEYNIR